MPRLFCFGFGYCAQHIAASLQAQGWQISGTCQTNNKANTLTKLGYEVLLFNSAQTTISTSSLTAATHVLVSIPPDEKGSDLAYHYYLTTLQQSQQLTWLGYLSATSVYGDYQGAWVTETAATRPSTPSGQRRLVAEQHWFNSPLPVHIFRLAGIYGPGRSVIDRLQQGQQVQRIDKTGQVFSRIHVADIAQIVMASMQQPKPHSIYNCADDQPCAQADVVAYACELLNLPIPALTPFTAAELSPMAKQFYQACRRVRNDKIKQELKIVLRYPSYRQGLEELINQ